MADYIYLLQNRLTRAQRHALESVRDAARAHSVTVFLVGGAVRDLSSGAPVRDLDFAVQGEVAPLLEELKAAGARTTGKNPVLGSEYLIFPGGVRAELGPTLSVTYPKPAQPETQPATILDDLRRRDFTANAMAISLNEGSYGLLLDPLNGIADLENRELRLVSNYGFIEEPVSLLRAARLRERLGWTLEERTEGRFATAKEENYLAALTPFHRGYELEEIFHEEDPMAALEHLEAEGWRDLLFPAWSAGKADTDGLERVRDFMGQLEALGISIDPSPVFFPLLTAKLAPEELASLKATFVRPGFVEQIDTLDARSKELGSQITGRAAASPSETWKLLFAAEPEVVLWLAYSARTGAVQTKLKAFLNDWPQMRQRIPYALMQEMRITPELPGYAKLLEDLFFALIDGKLATPEATRAFLEPYSPPAPAVQVSPRRRPAKSARGRSRKVVAAVEAVEENELPDEEVVRTDDAEDRDDREDRDDTEEQDFPGPEPEPASALEPEPALKKEQTARTKSTNGSGLPPSPKKSAGISEQPPTVPGKAAAKRTPAAPPTRDTASPASPGKVRPGKAAAAPVAAAPVASEKPKGAQTSSAKTSKKLPTSAAKVPAKPAPGSPKATVASKGAAPVKAPKGTPARTSAAKVVPAKVVAAKGVKAVAKSAVKGAASKQAQVARVSGTKVAAKKQVAAASRPAAAAKRPAVAKKAVKAPAKKTSRR